MAGVVFPMPIHFRLSYRQNVLFTFFFAFDLQKIEQFVWSNHYITYKESRHLQILWPDVVQWQYLMTEKMLHKLPKDIKQSFPLQTWTNP